MLFSLFIVAKKWVKIIENSNWVNYIQLRAKNRVSRDDGAATKLRSRSIS